MSLRAKAILFVVLFVALCLLFTIPVAAQQATLTAHWEGQTLIVEASSGSLYLVGGGRGDTWIGSGLVELTASGVDAAYSPLGRDAIVLKDGNGEVVATVAVPRRAWVVILPIVVN